MPNKLKIYGFYGNSGSGKDYLGTALSKMLNPSRKCKFASLADQLKIVSMVEDRLAFERVFICKDMESRRSLQLRGTELGRNVHGADYWVRYLVAWIRRLVLEGFDTIFVTDIRFPEEYALRELQNQSEFGDCQVKIFKVKAPQRTYQRRSKEANGDEEKIKLISNHPSETALNHLPDSAFDAVFYNDPGESSLTALRYIALEENESDRAEHVVFLDLDDTICQCSIYYQAITAEVRQMVLNYLILDVHPPIWPWPGDHREMIAQLFDQHFGEYRNQHETMEFDRDTFARALYVTSKTVIEQICSEVNVVPDVDHLNTELNLIFECGKAVHDEPFEPLPGALDTVHWLNSLSNLQVVIVTVGERPDQIRKLGRMGLLDMCCETTMLKSAKAYRDWMLKYPAKRYTMIGDSYNRDVKPALEAGIQTVVWINSNSSNWPTPINYLVAPNLEGAVGLVMSLPKESSQADEGRDLSPVRK